MWADNNRNETDAIITITNQIQFFEKCAPFIYLEQIHDEYGTKLHINSWNASNKLRRI